MCFSRRTRERETEVIENANEENASGEEAETPHEDPRPTTPSASGPAFPIIYKQGKRGSVDDNAGVTELIKATILQ